MHVHIGTVEFFTVAAYVIIFGFLWRALSVRLSDNSIGQAMAWIY